MTTNKIFTFFLSILVLAAVLTSTHTAQALKKNDGLSTMVVFGLNDHTNITFKKPWINQNITVSAGDFYGSVDGDTAKFYCIDLQHNIQYNPHEYTDDGETPPEITYILNNYYPKVPTSQYSGALSSINNESAAIQSAIWHFSDSLDLTTITNGTVSSRAQQIAADAIANADTTTPVQTLVFNPVSQALGMGTTASFVIEAYDENNDPAPGIEVVITHNSDGVLSEDTVYTDANGITDTVTLTQGTGNSAVVTATAKVTIPQGTRYISKTDPDNTQKLVLATPIQAVKQTTMNINWYPEADLQLTKTVSDDEPEDGDQITFTLTVTNNGPSTATGIQITDIWPMGVIYVGHTASTGTYDSASYIWTIPSLASGASAALDITADVDFSFANSTAFDLGPAAPYNVFVLKDITQPSSDTEGRMAVGRNANLDNYSVGDKLPNSNGTDDVLVVGRKITFGSGRVFHGNVVYGRFKNIGSQVSVDEGTVRQDTVVDFAAAETYLKNLSDQLRLYPITNNTVFDIPNLSMVGSNPFINVFEVKGSDLTDANSVLIDVPNGAVVIINISGNNINWSGGLEVRGTDYTNVIYNFYKARKITISHIDVTGTILAPKARVNFISGVQNGQMIAKFVEGQGQFNHKPFVGNIPLDTIIVNVAEITAVDQPDPDSEVDNGDTDEDDYAMVPVYLKNTGNVSSGNSGGGSGSSSGGTWSLISNVAPSQIIWTMTGDNDGNLLAGTFGGTIYKSFDGGANWTTLSNSLNVSYVWDIEVASDGKIYAGSEKGLYYSVDDGISWSITSMGAFKRVDVRSIAIDTAGAIYAGTWGGGLHKSTDGGTNWTDVTNGIGGLGVIHALVVNSDNEVFAGTYDDGLYYSNDGGASWTKTSLSYNHVWSMEVTSTDEIYVGTYGSGVYYSDDNGSSWSYLSQGLSGQHIYALSVDTADVVYANSWAHGIYSFSGGSLKANKSGVASGNSLGLDGLRISAITIDKESNELIASTENGLLYRLETSVTSINENGKVSPEEYNLSQNYPNPFNPSTKINFSVANAGNYTLTVYNVLGQQVATLISGQLTAGTHTVDFNASKLASGVYVYRLKGSDVNITKKMILIK